MAENRTTSMDLPPVLAQLLGPMTPPVTQTPSMSTFNPGSVGISSGMGQPQPSFLPSYAQGGMVGAGGMPVGGAGLQTGAPQPNMPPQQVELQIQEFMRTRPNEVAQIQQVVMAGLQAGEFTLEDFAMLEQMAMTALRNPEMYPALRNLAIQQGFATEQDLPMQYDQGLIITVLIAARAAQGLNQGQAAVPTDQMQSFSTGGMVDDKIVRPGDMASGGGKVVGPGTGTSDSIPIRVSTGEYVIPANVVRMKGKEFFDSIVEKYKDV